MAMESITLQTKRLTLKTLDESYAACVCAFYERNRKHLEPWEPARAEGFYTPELQAQYLADDMRKMEEGRMKKFWLFEKTDTALQNVIGSVSLNEIVRGCFLSCFIGYRIAAGHTNCGLMSEAVSAAVDYAFTELHLHRVEANVIPRNAASLRVAEKCGFRNEGLARQYLKIHGVWEDHVHMVRLNEGEE